MRFAYTILYVREVGRSLAFYELAFALQRRFLHESSVGGAMGLGCFTIYVIFIIKPGQRYSAAASEFMGLAWGLKEVAAAIKWKQEPEEDHYATTAEEIRESWQEEKMEKSGSMHTVFVFGPT